MRHLSAALVTSMSVSLVVGCGDSSVPTPFQATAQGGAAGAGGARPTGGSGLHGTEDPSIGNPCEDDAQCDDDIDCTADHCDTDLGRCRHTPEDAPCANDVFCDGEEVCDPRLGCVSGEPVSCSDSNSCTIDACVESDQSCRHDPRDADGDGDPDGNCSDGGDCDDTDPLVSSQVSEACGNGVDDDCDGEVDEADCITAEHDVCADFLEVKSSGSYNLSLHGAAADYAASCAGDDWRDIVVAITNESPATIDVIATAESNLALAAFDLCGDASSERRCSRGVSAPNGGKVARVRLHEAEPTTRVLKLFGSDEESVRVDVSFRDLEALPTNETCSTALPLSFEEATVVPIIGVDADLPSACSELEGDLVYELTLEDAADLEVFATSQDGFGEPILSLFSGSCVSAAHEVACRSGEPSVLFARALPPGTHYLGVSATGPTEVWLEAALKPATDAPSDDDCTDPPQLENGERVLVSYVDYADDVATECLPGGLDAVFSLSLEETSDVRILERLSDDDDGALALLPQNCEPRQALACVDSGRSPVRLGARAVPAGDYFVVAESKRGTPIEVTPFWRPSEPPLLVAFADTCDEAVTIPPQGAFLTGNTSSAHADYSAGCDRGTSAPEGAPDQMLYLSLSERRRVVFDMGESGYETVLDVRRGPSCPGEELVHGCSAGYVAGRSYLDLTLDAGEYWVQVDGYAGASGSWALDVRVADP